MAGTSWLAHRCTSSARLRAWQTVVLSISLLNERAEWLRLCISTLVCCGSSAFTATLVPIAFDFTPHQREGRTWEKLGEWVSGHPSLSQRAVVRIKCGHIWHSIT